MGKRKDYSDSGEGLANPFAALLKDVVAEKQSAPSKEGVEDQNAEPGESKPGDPVNGARLNVQMSRKGRGGKTITTVGGFSSAVPLKALARELGKSLGCGAFVEGDLIVIQGDQRDRLRSMLLERGAARVT